MKSYIFWDDIDKVMGFFMNFGGEGRWEYMLVLYSPWSKKDLNNSAIY